MNMEFSVSLEALAIKCYKRSMVNNKADFCLLKYRRLPRAYIAIGEIKVQYLLVLEVFAY